ncbi:MAG: thioredoxin-dependent thiol peroxidase [Bacteroidales bacterium]|nr:thioredoxin-dependent thiol peroxidase [Bacteroidales bacterium]
MTHLKVGEKAPGFTARDHNGNKISLDDYKGKKLVLFFYPKADTPGCTAEACNLRDNIKILMQHGFYPVGVSADAEKKQKAFAEKFSFPYPLIPDSGKEILKAYGVWGLKKFMGREYEGIHRTTFVIGEEGKIEKIFDKVDTKAHSGQILNEYNIT